MTPFGIALRAYLLLGLAAHKALWELMKRRQGQRDAGRSAVVPLRVRFIKAVKVAITLGLFTQVFLPDVLPISSTPGMLRITGAAIYTLGLLTAVVARIQLGRNWSDIEVGQVKRDHLLVNNGVYRYVRHPIYTGDIAMLLGFELCLNSWLVLAAAAIAIPTIYQAVREEKLLAKTVGGYELYCQQTKRFIPFIV